MPGLRIRKTAYSLEEIFHDGGAGAGAAFAPRSGNCCA